MSDFGILPFMQDQPLNSIQPMSGKRLRPAVLVMMDGFGIAPDSEGNGVSRAKMPFFNELIKRYPVVTLRASGEAVGLMWGEMGNSEVGHLTAGTGRVFYQSLPRIERAIKDQSFFQNEAFLKIINHTKQSGGTLHLMGILSSGKVHGYDAHCHALLDLAKQQGVSDVAIHAFLDGRDTLYNSGINFIEALEAKMKAVKLGRLASMSGRFYAMDRDNRWDRIEKAYNAIVLGQSAQTAENASEILKASYAKEVYDEEFPPTVMTKKGQPLATVKPGDGVIFFNFRPDRAREIARAFVLPTFDKFPRKFVENVAFVSMMELESGLPSEIAFPPIDIKNCLAEVLSASGLVQLHIAETEKYAHVTFFFNGMKEEAFPNEDRVIIPSPKVPSYDAEPKMSAGEITDRVIKEVETGNFDVIIMNYANPDMVAHTGNLQATIEAMEFLDGEVSRLVDAVLKQDGLVLITADHGNAEEVQNLQTGDIDKEHSTNPIPFFIIANQFEGQAGISGDVPNGDLSLLPPVGMLADVAPTLLKILGIPQPPEMDGTPLI